MNVEIVAFLGLLIGGLVNGIAGFAFALFANASLALALPPSVAVPTVLLVGSTLNLALVWENRVALTWRTLRQVPVFAPYSVAFVLAGLAAGSFLLGALTPALGRVALGLVILVFVAFQVSGWAGSTGTGRVALSVAGLASGLLNGWLGSGGPVIAMYLTALRPAREAFIVGMAMYFLVSDVFRAGLYALYGYWTVSVLRLYLLLIPFALLSYGVGVVLRRRFTSPTGFRRIVLALLAMIGASLIVRGALS